MSLAIIQELSAMNKIISKSGLKSILLCFLILSSVLLSSELWLTNGHSFFIARDTENEGFESYFFMPRRMFTSTSGYRFAANYLTAPDLELHEIIKAAIGNDYISSELDYRWLINRGIFFDYNLSIPSYLFEQYFGPIQLEFITGIFLSPSEENSTLINIFFFDSVNNVAILTNIQNSEYHSLLVNRISEANARLNIENIYYESSVLMGFNLPSNNFLARWQDDEFTVFGIEQQTFTGLPNVFEIASRLFPSPGEVWPEHNDGIYRFSTSNSVLVFDDVLTYTNHRPNRLENTDILTNFNAARSFMQNDALTVVLAGFKHSEEVTTFYFDYVIGNFPIYLEEPFLTVIVDSGVVVSYIRKMPFILNPDPTQTVSINMDVINLIDTIGPEYNISFGYVNNTINWAIFKQQ